MKPSLTIKTLFRSPARTLLTFVLLAATTFAFFSQTAEYAVTSREFDKAASKYVGVGTVEAAPPKYFFMRMAPTGHPIPFDENGIDKNIDLTGIIEPYKDTYQKLTAEQIRAVASSPYVTVVDTRYMTAAISDELLRLDDGGYFYSFTSRCVVEATFSEFTYVETARRYELVLSDCHVLSGTVPWDSESGEMIVLTEHDTLRGEVGGDNVSGQRMAYQTTPRYKYFSDYTESNLIPGKRYVFTLRYDTLSKLEQDVYYLSDHLAEPWCDAILPLDGKPDNYLEADEFEPLRKLIEITDNDVHTFDMVYTEDMKSIMRFATGKMAIVDGRELTQEDSENGALQCVISSELAATYGFIVGDTITMRLGTRLFEQYKGFGTVAVYPERYELPGDSATLEVAGIYTDTDGIYGQMEEPNWSYSINTIFVPKSLLPVPESELSGHQLTPAEFSFEITDAWDIPKFLKNMGPLIAEMGLTLIFDDGGWSGIVDGFLAVKQTAIVRIVVFSAAVAASIWITVYLFIGRKKRDYAIMRAFGTTKAVTARAMMFPLLLVTVVSIFVGIVAAWVYTARTVTQSSALTALEGAVIDSSVPAWVVIVCLLGEFVLTSAIAVALLRVIGAKPPLILLQGGAQHGGRMKRSPRSDKKSQRDGNRANASPIHAEEMPVYIPVRDFKVVAIPLHKVRPHRFVVRYIWKHIRRSFWKSALSVLVAALLLGTVGQLSVIGQSYTELFENTVITANVTGGMRHALVPRFKESDYVSAVYYARGESMDVAEYTTELIVTNNIARFTGEDVDITYANGYDATVMDNFGNVIIVGKTLMEKTGIELGDRIDILPPGYVLMLEIGTVQRYRGSKPDDPMTDNEILELFRSQISSQIGQASHKFIVAGVVTTPSGGYDRMAFTPGITGSSLAFGTDAPLDTVQFELADNYRAREFRDFGESTIGVNATLGIYFIMDTGRLENLENSMNLLQALYPIVIAAAMLIGGFLCCLMILQSSKEASIMRVLGTTKRKTRTILSLELASLNIAGLIVGFCTLSIYHGGEIVTILNRLYLFAALFVAMILACAAASSALATRRSALELLQTKE